MKKSKKKNVEKKKVKKKSFLKKKHTHTWALNFMASFLASSSLMAAEGSVAALGAVVTVVLGNSGVCLETSLTILFVFRTLNKQITLLEAYSKN